MYEIFAVAAILIAPMICGWYARIQQNREDSTQEIPDGGEDIATSSRLAESTCVSKKPEVPEPAIEIEVLTESALNKECEGQSIQEQFTASQETPMQQIAAEPESKPEIETQITEEETAVMEPQIEPQNPMPVSVSEPADVLESADVKAEQIAEVPAEPVSIDDQKLRIIDILSIAGAPKTVREIAQAYYGKGAYNKRKDSRIRRMLAEMSRDGLLIETNVNNSKAFEIKK